MNNIKLFTHTDLDGVGCYIALVMAGYDVDVTYCSYDDVNDKVSDILCDHLAYDRILITDISVNEDVANKLDLIDYKVNLIDHHATAEWLNRYEWANVVSSDEKGKTSGTSMVYDIFCKGSDNMSLDDFIEKVRRYDTWEWKNIYNDKSAADLNALFYLLGKEVFASEMIGKLSKEESVFSDFDKKLLRINEAAKKEYIDKKISKLAFAKLSIYDVGIVIADSNVSELGNAICETYEDLDMAMIISHNSISLRSIKDNIDVGKVAKLFNGGGHKSAAGIPIESSDIIKFAKKIMPLKNITSSESLMEYLS